MSTRKSQLIALVSLVALLVASCSPEFPSTNPSVLPGTPPSSPSAASIQFGLSHSITPSVPVKPTPVAPDVLKDLPPGQYAAYSDAAGHLVAVTLSGSAAYELSGSAADKAAADGSIILPGDWLYDLSLKSFEDISFIKGLGCTFSSGSSDRKYYALACDDGELYIYSLANQARYKISARSQAEDDFEAPLWSPDGKWIAYIRNVPVSPQAVIRGQGQLFVVDAKCLAVPARCLTLQQSPLVGNFFNGIDYSYSWSPDSTSLAVPPHDGFGFRIYELGSEIPRWVDTGDLQVLSVAWSQDGQWIIFTGKGSGAAEEIYKIPSSGGSPIQLTSQGGINIARFTFSVP